MIEAVLALVILVLALSSLLVVQSTRVRACSRVARLFDRIQHAALLMHESTMRSAQKAQEKTEKTIMRPETRLTYMRNKPAENSALKNFRSIELERVTIAWRDGNTPRTDALVTCRYTSAQQQEAA